MNKVHFSIDARARWRLHCHGADLAGASVTYGETIEEAKAMGREAITLHLEVLREHDEPILEETTRPRPVTVDIAAQAGNEPMLLVLCFVGG